MFKKKKGSLQAWGWCSLQIKFALNLSKPPKKKEEKKKVVTREPNRLGFIKRSKRQLVKSFTLVIRVLSTYLIKPNFNVSLSHRRSTTVSLETRNLTTLDSKFSKIQRFGIWCFFSNKLKGHIGELLWIRRWTQSCNIRFSSLFFSN